MPAFTVALLQVPAAPLEVAGNRARGEDACRRAKSMGADLALFPEMFSVGYALPAADAPEAEVAAWAARAEPVDGSFVSSFQRLARELEMAVAVTWIERWDPAPRNSVAVFDRRGDLVLTYAKVHTCDFDRERHLTPGDGFHVATLETAGGPVRIGAMICFDREHPESARVLMLKGAEIILTPNACGLEMYRLQQFRTRAWENMVGVAMANYPAPQENGHSVAFDPIAFPEGRPPRDTLVVEAGEAEGIWLAPFEMDAIRAYRSHEALGNAWRKPGTYQDLVSFDTAEPFVRKGDRRAVPG